MSRITKKNIDQALKFVYSENNSLSVIFHDNDLLMGIVGEFNKNLQELEKITKCNFYSRGNSIMIKSDPDTASSKKTKFVNNIKVNKFANLLSFKSRKLHLLNKNKNIIGTTTK